MKRPRQFEVIIDGRAWDCEDVSYTRTARSRAAARFDVYRDVSDCCDITFRQFLKYVKSVRLTGRRTPYDYIREFYGVSVEVGQRVDTFSGRGVVGEPRDSNPRACHVSIFFDGTGEGLVHPMEIKGVTT